jgi:hypothetical protein
MIIATAYKRAAPGHKLSIDLIVLLFCNVLNVRYFLFISLVQYGCTRSRLF